VIALLAVWMPAFASQFDHLAFLLAVLTAVLAVRSALRDYAIACRVRALVHVVHANLRWVTLRLPMRAGAVFSVAGLGQHNLTHES
jgi:hypothetical protein